jgi:hypothetical protein
MPPILAFLIGALGCEGIMLGLWWTIQPKPSFASYFEGQIGHFIVLGSASGIFCTLWKLQALDKVLMLIPDAWTGDWAKSGVPFTPEVGVLAGFIMAFRGIDRITQAFKARRALAVAPTEGGTTA